MHGLFYHRQSPSHLAAHLADLVVLQVIAAYEKDGITMLLQAFDDASFLERLTGLDKLFAESEALMESVDWSEEEDEAEL